MLRKLLKQKIVKMLNPEDTPFKILILDDTTKNLMAPLFKVSDLRANGICFHSTISNSRTSVKDIPAIYFVSDINAATNDILRFMYSKYHIYCSTQIKRSDLESMAVRISETQNSNKIISVEDSFVQFIPLQEDLFTLQLKNSFCQNFISEAVIGIFSVFVTLNEIPFIVANPSTNQILKKLESKIKTTKIIKNTIKKPLLILVDRNIDLITPTKHSLGYLELLEDVFNISLNQIQITDKNGEIKKVDLDAESDFLQKYRFEDFPVVAELVENELHSYKKELAIRNLKNASDISKVLENAPELQKKNEIINTNLNLCINLLEVLKERKIDDFYRMENAFDQASVMELSKNGTENDIIRFCINLIGTKNADLVDPILKKRNIKTTAVDFIRDSLNSEESFANKFTKHLKSLIFKKNIPIVNYVEDILSKIKNGTVSDSYETGNLHSTIFFGEISKIVLYIDGGATYYELRELKLLEKKYGIPVILGGSEILNAESFLKQVVEKANK